MDCSPPGSSVHVIFQARVLQWVAISFSRRSSWCRNWTWVSHIACRCFTVWATREVPSWWHQIHMTSKKKKKTFCKMSASWNWTPPSPKPYRLTVPTATLERLPGLSEVLPSGLQCSFCPKWKLTSNSQVAHLVSQQHKQEDKEFLGQVQLRINDKNSTEFCTNMHHWNKRQCVP